MFSLEKEKNMEELKMKRKIESLGIILMAIALIVSCKASADNATGRVTLNINAMVKEAEKALLNWHLRSFVHCRHPSRHV